MALLACAAIVAVSYRRDWELLAVVLLPQVAAIFGYAFFLAPLDHYYYLSVIPVAVVTAALVPGALLHGAGLRVAGIALAAGALAVVPSRVGMAATLHKLPQYGALVRASRTLAGRGQPLRAVETEIGLPRTSDPEFLYRILGGAIDREAAYVGVIMPDGRVDYRRAR
jgi:hypothetical protein